MIKKKKAFNLFAFAIIILVAGLFCYPSFAFDLSWNDEKSDHFIVYFHHANPNYVAEIIRRAESYYNSIAEDFGFTRYGEFWTWDNRAKIYVYDNNADYQKDTNSPKWSGAHVNINKREIYTYINMKDFYDVILPHE